MQKGLKNGDTLAMIQQDSSEEDLEVPKEWIHPLGALVSATQ
jgi:hypothetical protein